MAIFKEIHETEKYEIQIGIFAKNIVREALSNTNSFLYHEAEGYDSGLIGYHKPLSQAMFANYKMVESIGTLLSPEITSVSKWNATHLKAYCRLVLITLEDYTNKSIWIRSNSLYRARIYIQEAVSGLYKLNTVPNTMDNDSVQCLQVVMDFIRDAVKILDSKDAPNLAKVRIKANFDNQSKSFYDEIASMISEIILHASAVQSPQWECWQIQHNTVWGPLYDALSGKAGQVIHFKLRRIMYDEIIKINSLINFRGAKTLGFCLNVMGLKLVDNEYYKKNHPLQKAILSWTKKNYVWLHNQSPRAAEACLVDGVTYDAENLRLVKSFPALGLLNNPSHEHLELDPEKPAVY
ncbi:hypothetical protein D3C77_390460 [compost metagenome]